MSMSDLIERQAAIDAVEFGITYAKAFNRSTGEIKELFKEGNKALNEAVERLKDLPSAQPEQLGTNLAEVGTDYISRQAVMDVLFSEPLFETGLKKRGADVVVPVIYEKIKSLPSVQPSLTQMDQELDPTCADCLSRQAAIDVLADMQGRCTSKAALIQNSKIWQQVKDLPSAQPCMQTCKSMYADVSDLVSRSEAIDVLDIGRELLSRVLDETDVVGVERAKYEWGLGLIESYISDMEALPSAQPEIIRCKDCKYMTKHYDTDGNAPYWTCSEWDSGTDYDGFCHYAERRTDG